MSGIEAFHGTNRDIEGIAIEFHQSLGSKAAKGTASLLRSLVERTGGTVTVTHDPSEQEAEGGSLKIRGEQDYTIFLSPYTTTHRDNFTIAHEVGHYALHFYPRRHLLPVPLWFTRYGTGLVEWQANRFAAALLMPQHEFKKKFREFDGNLSLLSGLFSVSQPAVEVRAKSLGLLPQ